jgi:lipoprotein-anchoring transpeptidase ErfK/SrfK
VLHEWHDDGGPGKVAVRISLSDQIAEFERGKRPIGWCYVATGRAGHGTSPGNYQISEKIVDKYSTHYGMIEDAYGNVVNGDATPGTRVPAGMVYVPAPMPYWMRLTSYGIGMHGGVIPEPGKPASHGCIRMPKDFAPILFDAVEIGTPVTITASGAKTRRAPMPEGPQLPQPWVGDSRVISTRPLSRAER